MRFLRFTACAAAVVAASALMIGAAETSVTAAPPPPVPAVALPPAIDLPSFYEKQAVCDSVARPGVLAMGDLLLRTYGPATAYITRACTGSVSEHFDGRALDWMRSVRDPVQAEQAESFLSWLLAPAADGTPMEMARRMGIMYVIWNNRMIRMYDSGRGWTNYRNCLSSGNASAGSDTNCHRNHIHMSFSWDGAAGATSWWTGAAVTAPYCSKASSGAAPGGGDPVVVADPATVAGLTAVTPTVVLDTAAGKGVPAACRVLAGRALPVNVVASGVLGKDARSVALSVTVRSNAPASVAIWSSGRTQPAGQISAPIATDVTTTMLVPLSSLGTIGVATNLGSANVTISVIGYLNTDLPGPPGSGFAPPGSLPIPTGVGVSAPVPPSPSPAPPAATTPPPVAVPAPAISGTKPGKPRIVKVATRKGDVLVTWKKPAVEGTAPIAEYQVAAFKSLTQLAKVAGLCKATPDKSSCTIKGLKKGRSYYLSLRATSPVGSTWAVKKRVKVR